MIPLLPSFQEEFAQGVPALEEVFLRSVTNAGSGVQGPSNRGQCFWNNSLSLSLDRTSFK